ncbi:MAG: flagellar biosynthesis protein FlhB [Rhodospirillales bacterium]|nr:flagellar biosynthesis protein FlhB [Rhodospirillales bacterium]
MAEEDESQKTEDPTSKKLSKARSKGQAAISQEIKSWGIILAGAMGMILLAPGIMHDVSHIATKFIISPHAIAADFKHLRFVIAEVLLDLGIILWPFLLLLMVVALAGNVGQIGFMWATEKIKPDVSKISIVNGAKRLVSMRAIVEFLKGILKLIVVAIVAFGLAMPILHDLQVLPFFELTDSLNRIYIIAIRLMLGTVAVMTAVAILDFIYQKYAFTKQMKMSKQEVKDENKQSEGDPQIKARIRKLRVERAQQRMMAAVPEADVVVTNPTHYAVALKYDMQTMPAPKLVAKGVDSLAQRIREVAEDNDVPILENPPLARALYAAVELDDEIPPEHYKAVAEVIGYVMRLRGELRDEPQPLN